MKPLFDCCRH